MHVLEAMEEWDHADDRVIHRSYTAEFCTRARGPPTGWTLTAMPVWAALFSKLSSSKASTSLTAAVIGSRFTTLKPVLLSLLSSAF